MWWQNYSIFWNIVFLEHFDVYVSFLWMYPKKEEKEEKNNGHLVIF